MASSDPASQIGNEGHSHRGIAYRVGDLERDVDLVDVRAVLGDDAGHLATGERDVHALAGFQREARRRLEPGPDHVGLRVLAQLVPPGLLLAAVHHRAHGVLRYGHRLAHFRRFHRLDDSCWR